jgi:hypothetical protein
LVTSTSYEDPHSALLIQPLYLHLSLGQSFSSAPCRQTPSVYFLP